MDENDDNESLANIYSPDDVNHLGGIVFVVHVTTMYILASFYVCGSHQSIFTGYAAVAWNYLVLLVGV